MRLYFDLDHEGTWHRREWQERIDTWSRWSEPEVTIVDRRNDADGVVSSFSPAHFGQRAGVFGALPQNPDGRPTFVWDYSDQPAGRQPGFYCSLPRSLHDPRRHRSFCYPLRYNECIAPADFGAARHLYGFVGAPSSGLRGRMVKYLRRDATAGEQLLLVREGPWTQMFDRSGIAAKADYARAIAACKFFLCPRGNGVGTVRLFETMESARVPVIISDEFVAPAGIDWPACSIRIRERDVHRIPAILRARADEWPALATRARAEWEKHFGERQLLKTLGRELARLDPQTTLTVGARDWRLFSHYAKLRGRQLIGRVRGLVHGR